MAEPFSKSDKDWSKATKLIVKDLIEKDKILGHYSYSDRSIVLNPRILKESKGDTVAHEISHLQLGHKSNLSKEEVSDRLRGFLENTYGKDILDDPGDLNFMKVLEEQYLSEFEVRIFQKESGYYQDVEEGFKAYLRWVLLEYPGPNERYHSLLIALQAISNLQKGKKLSGSRAKFYRRIVYGFAKQAGIKLRK